MLLASIPENEPSGAFVYLAILLVAGILLTVSAIARLRRLALGDDEYHTFWDRGFHLLDRSKRALVCVLVIGTILTLLAAWAIIGHLLAGEPLWVS